MDVHTFRNGRLVVEAAARTSAKGMACTPEKSCRQDLELTPPKSTRVEDECEKKLNALVSSRRFLALSLPQCPQCDELASFLASQGVPSTVFVKWDKADPQYPALKLALSAFAGSTFSFPQVFVDGEYQGGYHDVMKLAQAGRYDQVLAEEFGVEPSTVRRQVEGRPMVVLSLPSCPQCDELRAALEKLGLPTGDIFLKWDKAWPQYQSLKSQLIDMTGRSQFSFPQTFIRGQYEGGFDEVMAQLEKGSYSQFFEEAFGVSPPAAPPAPDISAAIAFDEDF